MTILALETSTDACIVTLQRGDDLLVKSESQPRRHLQLILPMIDAVMAEAEFGYEGLDAIAFGCGPGSFTGVRIAASVAQGVSFGADLKVIPISTLAIMAQSVYCREGVEQVAIAQDALQGEAYFGVYSLNSDGVMLPDQPEKLAPLQSLPYEQVAIAGNAWELVDGASLPKAFSTAIEPRALADLASFYLDSGVLDNPLEALPTYLRKTVVKSK